MHFYIKFVEGPFLGKKYAVPDTAIKYSFNADSKVDIKKKYMCVYKNDTPYKCQILLDAESPDKLQMLIKESKRIKNVPISQLVTTTSDSESQLDSQSSTLSNVTVSENKDDSTSYNKHLFIKLQKIKNNTELTSKDSSKSTELDCNNKENVEKSVAVDQTSTKASKKLRIRPSSLENILNNVVDKSADDSVSDENECHDIHDNNELDKIKTDINVHSANICEKKISTLKEDNCKLKIEINTLKKEKKEKNKKIDDLNKKLQEEKGKSLEYMELNKELQKVLLEKFQEKARDEQLLKNEESYMDLKKIFFPVGFLRKSDNKIHIGRNMWLDHQIYSNVINQSKNPVNCVGNILTSIFGIETLQNGTITGRQSNRSKQESQEVKQLDPITVAACKDFYGHWIKTVYLPNNENTQSFEFEFANFNEYF